MDTGAVETAGVAAGAAGEEAAPGPVGPVPRAGLHAADFVVTRVVLAGQAPVAGTELPRSAFDGMMDRLAPVWASDHRALYADVQLTP